MLKFSAKLGSPSPQIFKVHVMKQFINTLEESKNVAERELEMLMHPVNH